MKGRSEVSGANCEVIGTKSRGRRGDNLDNDVGLIYVARSVVLLAGRKLTGINAVGEVYCQACSTVQSVHLCTLCLAIR
jgi:metal-dependent hydrolase (beta-lactamase superfamily II)